MNVFFGRILRTLKLDPSVYEEVEHDSGALFQAVTVVILSSLAAGIGNSGSGEKAILWGIASALAGWFIWAYITWFIGTKMLPEKNTISSHGELLRTIGFSSSPGLVRIFGMVPVLGTILVFMSSIWMLISMVIAVKQALDYESTVRAIMVVVIGWFVYMLMMVLLMLLT